MRMFDFMLFLVLHCLCIKINAITIDSYQVEVFNARTKYTFDLKKTIGHAVYINQSDSVAFSCTSTGTSFYVALLRNDNELKREYLQYGETGKLTVTYTQTEMGCSDAAKFTCRAGSSQEWPNITAIIIVKCPVHPVRFKSNNVNKIAGAKDLTFRCEKSKDVETNEPYNLTIRRNGVVISKSSIEPFIELGFPSLKCEDMGTYSCETETKRFTNYSQTDLFVHYCPPLLSEFKKTIKSGIGRSVNFTLKTTMSRKLCVVTVLYKEYQTECDKCETKLCAKIVSKENWVTQINISILNLTEEDFGNQNISICTATVGQLHCGNFSLIIMQDDNAVISIDILNNTTNSTLGTYTQVQNVTEPPYTVKSSKKGSKGVGTKKTQKKGTKQPGQPRNSTMSDNSNNNLNGLKHSEKNTIKTDEDKKLNKNKKKEKKGAKLKKSNKKNKKKENRKPNQTSKKKKRKVVVKS